MKEKRRDNKGRILHTGESQRTDGKYLYINVNIKMYIFDHLRMYIFAIPPLDRYIFSIDKIFQ